MEPFSIFTKKSGEAPSARVPNPLSYPQSTAPFSTALFQSPTSEYRGCPLWSWNTKLNKEQLLRQIDNFKDMGLGGFHIHVRVGLDTEYLGDEFMELVRACVEYAESKNMLACLYDEDRWPSGSAGGLVVKEFPEHKHKHLLFTPRPYSNGGGTPIGAPSGEPLRSENGYLLAAFDIELDENAFLRSSRVLQKGESGENVWYAYVETNPMGAPWFNGQSYVDTMSKGAIAQFIKTTYEVYQKKLGNKFGLSVRPIVFTDEPQLCTKKALGSPRGQDDAFLPWTDDLLATFHEASGLDLTKHLPELIWNLPDGTASVARYHFHDHTCELFVSAFMDQIGQWCQINDIFLTGHMNEEPTLWSQTTALGEAMRCYRGMQLPGMDLLMDRVEYNTAKQVSSIARQNGIRGAMSETYGVTHWYFTFEGHKGCGDWQAALGITFRVQHLTWVSMAGEGKRDYPASIGYQSPWYKEYSYIENHFSRVNVVLTRGKPVTRIAVIHPIESYWLGYGPNNSGDDQGRRDSAFEELTSWLLHALLDFDFVSESLLPHQTRQKRGTNRLLVGKCEYDVVIVPNLRTIRSLTLDILRAFAKSGGKVIIAGSSPNLVDAKVPKHAPIIAPSETVFWSQQSILTALERFRDVRVEYRDSRWDTLLYQMREDGDERFTFICNTDRNAAVQTTIHIRGKWKINIMDTFTGQESSANATFQDGWTIFPYRFEGCASVLLHQFSVETAICQPSFLPSVIYEHQSTASELKLDSVKLSEPNVLLLDFAEYQVGQDGNPWEEVREVLQIDNIIRGRFNLPLKGAQWKQPWTISESERKPVTFVTLRFKFESAFEVTENTMLAVENAEALSIHVNGSFIPSTSTTSPLGWWVDEDIKTVPISGRTIRAGVNTITLGFPFGLLTNIERLYLLGEFSVQLQDRRTTLLQPLDLKTLAWGDITTQGLPFYVGNITYNCSFITSPADPPIALSVPQFSSPVLKITSLPTQEKLGVIALQPRQLPLQFKEAGEQKVAITAYGDRYNSFGHLHLPDNRTNVCEPNMWRTGGDWWSDEYFIRPMGVLQRPSILLGSNTVEEAVGIEEEDIWDLVETPMKV